MKPLLRSVIMGAALWAATPTDGKAQSWPTRPVRLIVPFAPGGSTDNSMRPFAEKLSQALGQQFVIENKGGAGGQVGVEAISKSPPDGYTFGLVTTSTLTVLPNGRKTAYDPFKDFAYVGRFAYNALVLAVLPDFPATNVKEFVAVVQASPGRYFHGSSGLGTLTQLSIEVLKDRYDLKMEHVPYRGGGEALVDFLAGNVQVYTEGNVAPHVKAGKAKLLAVMDTERHPEFPDVPLMSEQIADYNVVSWFGLVAPAGVPAPIVAAVNAEMNKAARMPDVQVRLQPLSLRGVTDTPGEMEAETRREHARYAALMRKLNIALD